MLGGNGQGLDVRFVMVTQRQILAVQRHCSEPSSTKTSPKIWMGAGSPPSVKQVAQLGFNMLLGQYDPFDMIIDEVETFKCEVESLGRTFDPLSVAVARS
ncbi:MAG: hypothetical protein CM1200mP27_10870 [Chloroflexota bacterium]|nr:MAG: hypothetical protein CM1200mP27_10870 [Chloroflexota bacterium]